MEIYCMFDLDQGAVLNKLITKDDGKYYWEIDLDTSITDNERPPILYKINVGKRKMYRVGWNDSFKTIEGVEQVEIFRHAQYVEFFESDLSQENLCVKNL